MSAHSRQSRLSALPTLTPAEPAGYSRRTRSLDRRRPLERRRHNLPHIPSSFIGREQALADVTALLAGSRLVTLTGPGGMGKTRLATQVGLGLSSDFAAGVWLVELASLTDPAPLPEVIGAVLPSLTHHPGPYSADDLASHIGDQCILLVLDNCEHLLEPCGRLVDLLLRSCPGMSVLATSREPLGVAGEHRWSVGALSLPGQGTVDAASVRKSGAGKLFIQRATASRPSFRLTAAMAPTVTQICHRLDGMPLAIELAAARVASLSPADVLERLDDRFHLLTTRSATVVPRHRSLLATLEWSQNLLSPAEAGLLRRVSVFADWTLEAAQQICAGDEVVQRDVLDHLAALAAKSLVVVDTLDDGVRYRLLETVRAWAMAKLEASAEGGSVTRRHALWCLDLAERAEHEQGGVQPSAWLDRLEAEHDNLRTALTWARTMGDRRLGVRLVTVLGNFWRTRGHLQEGLAWLEWATANSDGCPALLRARLLRETGMFRGMLGDMGAALPLLEESSALFAEAGDHDASLCACNSLFDMFHNNPRRSLPALTADIDRCRRTGDLNKLAHFLGALGQAHFLLGDVPAARRFFGECVEIGRGQPDGAALRTGLFGLGRVAVIVGEPAVAEAAFEEAGSQAEAMADVDHMATATLLLGDLARVRGEWKRSRRLLGTSIRILNADGTSVDEARTCYFSARLAEATGVDGDNGSGELFRQALSLGRATGAPGFHEVRCLLGVGWASQANGDVRAATGGLLEALGTAQALGDVQATAQAFDRLSGLARLEGNLDEAETLAKRGLELHHRIGDVVGTVCSLESVAGLAVDGGRWQAAAQLLSTAQAQLDAVGYVRSARDQARHEGEVNAVRTALGEDDFASAWTEGAATSPEAAVAYAMKGRASRERPATGWDSLTPAERQVAELVGQGLTNPEVGRRLFVSPRTVGHHLAHIYQKLGIHARSALIKELAGREPVSG